MAVIAKPAFVEEPKWTTVIAKKAHQVVSLVVETLADTPKQKERKLNLRFTCFEAKRVRLKGAGVEVQHKAVARPNDVVRQGCRYHAVVTCDCVGLYLDGKCAP